MEDGKMQPYPYPDDSIDMEPTEANPPMEPLQRKAAAYPPDTPPLHENVAHPEDVESAEAGQEEAHTFAYLIAKANDYVGWVFLVLEVLLFLRFFLMLIGANSGNPFAVFLYSLTGAILSIFQGIVSDPRFGVSGTHVFEWSTLIGMLVYGLLFTALMRFLHIVVSRPAEPPDA
jgi:hypothetical protein